jgi:sentrin-specific protease 1
MMKWQITIVTIFLERKTSS